MWTASTIMTRFLGANFRFLVAGSDVVDKPEATEVPAEAVEAAEAAEAVEVV
jgi:hypothetical protein